MYSMSVISLSNCDKTKELYEQFKNHIPNELRDNQEYQYSSEKEKINIPLSRKCVEYNILKAQALANHKLKELCDDGYNIKKLHDEKPIYYRLGTDIGAVLHRDSNVVWIDKGEYVCKHCGFGVGYKQLDYSAPEYIELDSWNGNDLFKVREFMGAFYCTEKFKKLSEEAKFTGIEFEEVESR